MQNTWARSVHNPGVGLSLFLKTDTGSLHVEVASAALVDSTVRELLHLNETLQEGESGDKAEEEALKALGFENRLRVTTTMGGEDISKGSFEDWDVQEGSTLCVHVETIGTFKEGLLEALQSGDVGPRRAACMTFRQMLSREKNPPIDAVLQSGALPAFIEGLRSSDPTLQFEASWAITNVASGTTEHTRQVVQQGGVPEFVRLLSSPTTDVVEQAAWALGNIAGDGPQHRATVLAAGALPQMVAQMLAQLNAPTPKISLLRNATWSLSNMCRGKPGPAMDIIAPALPVLARLLHMADDEVLQDSAWALSYISDGTNDRAQHVVAADVTDRLVELLGHANLRVVTPALRTLGNIVSGAEAETQAALDSGVLPAMEAMLQHQKKGIKKEACWLVSNITAGTSPQIQAVLDSGVIAHVMQLFDGDDVSVRKEAAWAIANVTAGGSQQQIAAVVEQGAVQALCKFSQDNDANNRSALRAAVDGLQNILTKNGPALRSELRRQIQGAAEGLRGHTEPQLAQVASTIVTTLETLEPAEEKAKAEVLVEGEKGEVLEMSKTMTSFPLCDQVWSRLRMSAGEGVAMERVRSAVVAVVAACEEDLVPEQAQSCEEGHGLSRVNSLVAVAV